MGAETQVYVKVVKEIEEWVCVSAMTLDDAREKARVIDGVVRVVDVQYDLPYILSSHGAG